MEESIYVVLTEGNEVGQMSPRAKMELDREDLEILQRAVRAIDEGTPHPGVDLAGFECRIIPLADAGTRLSDSENDAGDYLAMLQPVADGSELSEILTPTQFVVAEYAASGSTVGEIADRMGRSPHTVKTHLRNIYERLDISSRVELASYLWRDGA